MHRERNPVRTVLLGCLLQALGMKPNEDTEGSLTHPSPINVIEVVCTTPSLEAGLLKLHHLYVCKLLFGVAPPVRVRLRKEPKWARKGKTMENRRVLGHHLVKAPVSYTHLTLPTIYSV